MIEEAKIPAIDISPTTTRVSAAVGAALLAGGSTVVAAVEPTKATFLPVCPLFAFTGLACPGCGLTRGFHALFHGDIITAIDFNIFTPFWAIILGWVFASLVLLAFRGRGLNMWPTNPRFMYAFMVVLVVFGVLRNIPAWPLTILFP
ncbi:MAG TPA: DUF2752 domain-containing protein [Pyrinomonadaceae bacterium]|nr:DUF2752 domain-containing protein [Pyrinomonadaceae bacterium]